MVFCCLWESKVGSKLRVLLQNAHSKETGARDGWEREGGDIRREQGAGEGRRLHFFQTASHSLKVVSLSEECHYAAWAKSKRERESLSGKFTRRPRAIPGTGDGRLKKDCGRDSSWLQGWSSVIIKTRLVSLAEWWKVHAARLVSIPTATQVEDKCYTGYTDV